MNQANYVILSETFTLINTNKYIKNLKVRIVIKEK